ncbi:MAG: hypothetical protein AAF532_03585 [Planctomycetota bacterium]
MLTVITTRGPIGVSYDEQGRPVADIRATGDDGTGVIAELALRQSRLEREAGDVPQPPLEDDGPSDDIE